MKKIISYILSVFIVLQAASGFALAENSAGAEYHIPESDYLYVDGDNRIRTVEGEQTLLFRLFVGEPQRVHILTSGVNVTLVIYNEAADAVVGAFTSVDGLLDAPFDAAPGSYLLGLSGWGEVAILAASEARTAQIYAQNAAPDATDETVTTDEAAASDETVTTDEAATDDETVTNDEVAASDETVNTTETTEHSEETLPVDSSESEANLSEPSDELPDESVSSKPADEQQEEKSNEVTPAAAEAPSREVAAEESNEPASSETVEESSNQDSSNSEEKKSFLGGFVSWLTGSGSSQPQTDASQSDEQPEAATAAVSETADATAEFSHVSDTVDETETADVSDTEDEAEATADAAQPVDEAAAADEAAATDEAVTTTGTIESAAAELTEETLSSEHSESNLSEPAFDPTLPINATIPMNQTVSLLSILSNAGAPVNVITYMSGETEGRLVAVSQSGDWLLTPYAYYDSLTLTVTATDYLAADSAASAVTLTVILSNPNPAASRQEFTAVSATGEADIGDLTEELTGTQPADTPAEEHATESPVSDESAAEKNDAEAPAAKSAVTDAPADDLLAEKALTEDSSQAVITDEFSAEYTSTVESSEELPEDLAEENAAKDEPAENKLTAEDPETDSPVLPGARVTVDRTGVNQITLHADTSDIAQPDALIYQWQYSLDGETWMDIPGATASAFSFSLDETTSTYFWRLLTSEKEVALNG